MINVQDLLIELKKLPNNLFVFLEKRDNKIVPIKAGLQIIDPKIHETLTATYSTTGYSYFGQQKMQKIADCFSILKIEPTSKNIVLKTLINKYFLDPGYVNSTRIESSTPWFNRTKFKAILKETDTPINVRKLIKGLNKVISSGSSSTLPILTQNILLDIKPETLIYTTYINGIGYNKHKIIYKDLVIQEGEALIINIDNMSVYHNGFSKMMLQSNCDFSIHMGCDRKKLRKYTKTRYVQKAILS